MNNIIVVKCKECGKLIEKDRSDKLIRAKIKHKKQCHKGFKTVHNSE